jgi:hypothetical protein
VSVWKGVEVRDATPDLLSDRIGLSPGSMLMGSLSLLPIGCKALSWALRGERPRLPDIQLRALPNGGRDLPELRPRQPVLQAVSSGGAGGKAASRGGGDQQTEAGRLNHKVRQEQYRIRLAEKVTHHGDLATMVEQDWAIAAEGGAEGHDEQQQESSEESRAADSSPQSGRRCHFCGRACRCSGRRGPLARPESLNRRGPRLPVYVQRC